jgi:predicted DNA binding CopG/RHH family protein
MVKMREPNPELAKKIEAFGDAAEQPQRRTKADEPKWKTRNREPKVKGFNLRLSKSQLALIKAASDLHEMKQQKFIEQELWPLLEEKYGYLLELPEYQILLKD